MYNMCTAQWRSIGRIYISKTMAPYVCSCFTSSISIAMPFNERVADDSEPFVRCQRVCLCVFEFPAVPDQNNDQVMPGENNH